MLAQLGFYYARRPFVFHRVAFRGNGLLHFSNRDYESVICSLAYDLQILVLI